MNQIILTIVKTTKSKGIHFNQYKLIYEKDIYFEYNIFVIGKFVITDKIFIDYHEQKAWY